MLVSLRFQFDPGELGQSTKRHVQDVVGLLQAEVEDLHHALSSCSGIVGLANQLDHLVDVDDRDEQALHKVQPILCLASSIRAPAPYDVDAVIQEDLQQFDQAKGAWLAFDQRNGVD